MFSPNEQCELDPKHKTALLYVLKVISSKSAHLLIYVFAFAALLAVPIGNLPANLVALATGIGVNALSDILDRLAYGGKISDDELIERIKQVVNENITSELLVNSRDVRRQVITLSSWNAHLTFLIENGHREIVELLTIQYKSLSDDVAFIRENISGLATKEQSSEIKRSLSEILEILASTQNRNFFDRSDLVDISQNPFIVGPAIRDSRKFYGRREELKAILNRVGAFSSSSVSVVGERRIGKSSLLLFIANQSDILFKSGIRYETFYFDLSGAAGNSCKTLIYTLRREMLKRGLPFWKGKEVNLLTSLSYTLEQLEDLKSNIRLVICLDEFEYINKNPSEFDGLLETLRAEAQLSRLTLITSSQRSLADLCALGRKEISPFYNIFTQVILGLLDETAWLSLIQDGFDHADIQLSRDDLKFIFHCAGYHPFFTQLSASILLDTKKRGISQIYTVSEAEFKTQAFPFFRTMLNNQSGEVKEALTGNKNNTQVINELKERGLFNVTERPFSSMFARFLDSDHSKANW